MRHVALGFTAAALIAVLLGMIEVALFLSIAAAMLAILAPDRAHRDARSRNQARRVR